MERPQPVPDLDSSATRASEFGSEAQRLWLEYLRALPNMPVAHPHTPAQVRTATQLQIPEKPMGDEEVFAHLSDLMFEHSTQTGHGGFMAYITGAGTVPGGPASLLAAGINQNLGGWPLSPGATEIESCVLTWFAQRLGFPDEASGAFVTGGATANLMALAVARDALADWNVRTDGVANGRPVAVYVSEGGHETVDRAADLLGLGTSSVRRIPTDDDLRIRIDALVRAIDDDIADGIHPLCVVATAGTTGPGAIDPLGEMADIATEYGCWLHVDAAYGGPAAMVDELRERFDGIERGDSITCDPHKWMNIPISSSLVLFRDPGPHLAAFTLEPDYAKQDVELKRDVVFRYQWTPQFSRPFDALPVWVSLLTHGWDAYERRMGHDVRLAQWLQHLVVDHDGLEPLTTPDLSIVCFRYVPPDLDESAVLYLNELNEQTLYAVQRAGQVYPSDAVIRGQYAIRACLIGYRTGAEHVETLIEEVVAHGRRLDKELRPNFTPRD